MSTTTKTSKMSRSAKAPSRPTTRTEAGRGALSSQGRMTDRRSVSGHVVKPEEAAARLGREVSHLVSSLSVRGVRALVAGYDSWLIDLATQVAATGCVVPSSGVTVIDRGSEL